MAKYCSQEGFDLGPICDFCTYFDTLRYFCTKHNKKVKYDEGCDDFEDFTIPLNNVYWDDEGKKHKIDE